ncbi:LutC/YkgG family protein [Alicyclobacillus sp. ALC3]|uniref:LutC/YkgG family protein n=1 Tax=Alicyclobacillus sp. ALC3 TaxID=2796143 RepID=UPI0023789364|nr:lactate utilization protein [Alicyclobacillus sp. ALC3]WDL95661.1 lactate utilization protein [Alicyclobacillus sp. ALC3]
MNKEAFLNRIATQIGRPRPLTQAPPRDVVGAPDFWHDFNLSPDERLARFEERFTGLGGEVRVVDDIAQLQAELAHVMADKKPKRIGMWNDAELEKWVGNSLHSQAVMTWGVDPRQQFSSIDIGITGCSGAIADTGTLVLTCGGGRGRSVHLLPSIHIAVVGASQIVTRLGEALERVAKPTEMDSYVHFVTGPSRSSDIENDQTIGIHGPAAVMAMVVREALFLA